MRAELVAVGSELLMPLRQETNGQAITARLLEIGIEVAARVVVADDIELVAGAFRAALGRADLVISTGGLGPTEDDLTREGLAAALGLAMRRDAGILDMLRERFARYGRAMAPVNEKQADVLEGARVLANPKGTAPGQWIERDGRVVVLLPGPPREMAPMLEEHVIPALRQRVGGSALVTRVLRIAAMSESDVEQALVPIYSGFTNPRTTILGGPAQVDLHLTASGATRGQCEERIEALASRFRERLPGRIYSEDGRELPQVVGELLLERRLTLAVAESCTGGLLASRLTSVPGSSGYLERGWVTYSDRSKLEEIGVASESLDAHGAVSEEVARELAEGARRTARTDLGIGVTGIAGPAGGSPEKPVGLVFVAIAGAAGDRVRRVLLPGERERVRFQATQVALEMLRRGLLGLGG